MKLNDLKSKKIMLIAILNMLIVILELSFGVISNSLSLITDALHNLGDVLALFVAFLASYYAQKSATSKMTFGYIRAEMMAAFVNSLFLCITMVYVLYEAIMRFLNPVAIDASSVIFVASIALIVNGISAYLLRDTPHLHHHGDSHDECKHNHEDLNLKAAYLHMLSDAVISFGVIIGAVVTLYFQTLFVDPLITFVFGAYILRSSFKLVRESFFSLMDANPHAIKEYEELILSFEEIEAIHDIHVTSPSSKERHFSAHIVLKSNKSLDEIEELIEKIRLLLKEKFGVTHSLIQPETIKYANIDKYCSAH